MRKITALSLLVLAALLGAACEPVAEEPTPVQPAESGKGGETSESKAAKNTPIKLAARRATADASVLASGDPLSCVRVTVTNRSKKNVEVNPLYFSITDTRGTKHSAGDALAEYEGQIPTVTLAPGENAKGLVCGKGKWKPAQVAMTNPLFAEAARAEVAE
ncbi:MAG TPA: hypothetical protein VF158_16315 [Longimicrobiales bacterium]